MEAVGLGERQGRGSGGGGGVGRADEGAKISISDFHILKALIYLARPGDSFKLERVRREEGVGGGGGGTKGEGTYDIFTVESHFHCPCGQHVAPKTPHASVGHTGCLIAHRCLFFFTHMTAFLSGQSLSSAICQRQQNDLQLTVRQRRCHQSFQDVTVTLFFSFFFLLSRQLRATRSQLPQAFG